MRSRAHRLFLGLCSVSLLFLTVDGGAQLASMTPDVKPYSAQLGGRLDSISTVNYGLVVNIPLWSIPQRGALKLDYTLQYISPSYSVSKSCGNPEAQTQCRLTYGGTVDGVGIVSTLDYYVSSESTQYVDEWGFPHIEGWYYTLNTPDGGSHNFVSVGGTQYRADDGTGWLLDSSTFTVSDNNGIQYIFASGNADPSAPIVNFGRLLYVRDSNGNQIAMNYTTQNQNGATIYVPSGVTDTMGRTIGSDQNLMGAAATDTSKCIGPNPAVSAAAWTPPGATNPIIFCSASVHVLTNFWARLNRPTGIEYTDEMEQDFSFLQNVVMMDGTSYSFEYQPPNYQSGVNYGELTKLTFPTGGFLKYTWRENFTGCQSEALQGQYDNFNMRSAVTSRYLDAADGVTRQPWQYGTANTNNNQWVTTIVDPLGNTQEHTVSAVAGVCGMYETQVKYFDTQNNLIKTDSTGYQAIPNLDYLGYANSNNLGGAALPTTHTTSWANGTSQTTTTAYDGGFTGTGYQGAATIPYGLPVTETVYDNKINGVTGPALKTTSTSYWGLQNSSALALNLLNRPGTVTVTDLDTSTQTTETEMTDYGYDENSTLAAGNASVGWVANNQTTRGNQTSISKHWNSTVPLVTSTVTFTETGQIHSESDPVNSAITPTSTITYSYDAAYDGGYRTASIDSLSHTTSLTYDFGTGHVTSYTDSNNQTVTYSYDSALRLSQISQPGDTHSQNKLVTYEYPDANHVTTKTYLNGGTSDAVVTTVDGAGRLIRNTHSDPDQSQGVVTVDTTYDDSGRKLTVSNPYNTTSDGTYGNTTFSYDGIGRVVQVTNPDNSYVQTSYQGFATQTTEESNGTVNVSHVSQVDGLGRLVKVCEVSTAAPTVGEDTPGPCGLEIAATGYLTTYGQSVRGLTSVTDGQQVRTFSYDALGQLADSVNPETGHIHYDYDVDGNMIAKTSPMPNASAGTSDQIIVRYSYGPYHRLLQKTYTGTTAAASQLANLMPVSTFNYDETAVGGKNLTNSVNKISSETTTLGGTQTASLYSYDAFGHVSSHYQCVLVACTSGSYNDVEYHYDGAGNITGVATPWNSLSAQYNAASHLVTVTPGYTPDSNHPVQLLTGAIYSPNGALFTASLGNGTTENYSYDNRWLTGMTVSGQAVQASATPSTGTIVITGSDQTKQVSPSGGAAAVGTLQISGGEGAEQIGCHVVSGVLKCSTIYSNGTISATVSSPQGTFAATVNYGASSTISSLASALKNALNNTANIPVSAACSVSGCTDGILQIVAGQQGIIGNSYVITFSTQALSTSQVPDGYTGDVDGSSASGNLGGGVDPTYSTAYDSGTFSVCFPTPPNCATTNYGQNVAQASDLATALVGPIHALGYTVTANGSSLNVTSLQTGASANTGVSFQTAWSSPTFTQASFSATSGGMTGGNDAQLAPANIYSYSLTHAANGKIINAADSVNGNWSYTYDEFNRLSTASRAGPGSVAINWAYDRYGNRWQQNITAGTGSQPGMSFSAATNQTSAFGYDSVGNVISDGLNSYAYDAENHIERIGSLSYVYDAEGRRVGKSDGTVYVVDLSGETLDEIDSGTWKRSEVTLSSRHLATVTQSAVIFSHVDWIGTERARSDSTQGICETESSYPFGDNVASVGTCSVSPKFMTGKERDSESQLDYFGARYLSSIAGRFMSPDWAAKAEPVPYSKLDNPQSLNLYAYVENDPITGIDVDGHRRTITGSWGAEWSCEDDGSKCMYVGIGSGRTSNEWSQHFAAQARAQQTQYTTPILGQTVCVTICGETAEQAATDRSHIDAAIAAINNNADQILPGEVAILHNIKAITVNNDGRTGIDVSTGTFNIRSQFLADSSPAFLGTAIAHDAYHVTQWRRGDVYTTSSAPRLEREANEFGIKVGASIGLSPSDIQVIQMDKHTLYNTNPY